MSHFRLPSTLDGPDDDPALGLLKGYYKGFVGRGFDIWDSSGTRQEDADRFNAEDLVAVTFLSVNVPPQAAEKLLVHEADALARLLRAVGADRDLADETAVIDDDWSGWRLYQALKAIPGIGRTKASKLMARKRPQLFPIWDDVIGRVTKTRGRDYWEPLRSALRADDKALHRRLLSLREEAQLPDGVSAIRVFDVIAWREGSESSSGKRLASAK